MQLKKYQETTLDILKQFFEEARLRGAKAAYEHITGEPEQAKRLRGYGGRYEPLLGQEDMPYVCLRLPTGGGKTLLAAHAIKIARDAWIEKDYPVVLWLVPSNMIRGQTVEALNDRTHPYRQALDDQFAGRVRVFDIGDFTQLRPHDLKSNACIIVGTIQTLRVENTEGRKVYAHHEDLEPHFSGIARDTPGLGQAKDGSGCAFSFANLLHIHRPLMIVDEAHNAVTGLSREMQTRVNPCAIIEFTATPRLKSNILHAVSALELKDEQMIKLPVRLDEHDTWAGAVTGAIAKRAELAEEAKLDKDGYIRPIVLFQAEDKDKEVTVEVLRQHLLGLGIAENAIAVATGNERGLDKIDLFDPDCTVEYVITVKALKEGWDCSFAYVFCSVANIQSATDAEQLLGRVLRMPYAKRRKSPMLNKAYANLVSKSFAQAANTLRDRLVVMGFEEKEAEANIEVAPTLDQGLWGERRRPKPSTRISVKADANSIAAVKAAAPEKIRIEAGEGDEATIEVTGFLREAEKENIFSALPEAAQQAFREEVAKYEAEHAHEASPAELGKPFIVPRLMAWVQDELSFAETDKLAEYFEWSLADHSAQMETREFSVTETAETFEIDLDGDSLLLRHSDQSDQLMLDVPVDGWTEAGLVLLLDKQVRDSSISQGELVGWLSEVVRHLTTTRKIPLATLMRCRFVLARKLREKIAAIRRQESEKIYQRCLFDPGAKPEISFKYGFHFFEGMFAGVPTYQGTKYRFTKHFLGWDQVAAFDGKADGDEFRAAQQLDSVAEVEYWVRNVPKHQNAFFLPLNGVKTYPDFVAKLKDGRLLVVEYKGDHLIAGSAEKLAVGQLWQATSEGQCIYVMAQKEQDGLNVKQQVQEAIA